MSRNQGSTLTDSSRAPGADAALRRLLGKNATTDAKRLANQLQIAAAEGNAQAIQILADRYFPIQKEIFDVVPDMPPIETVDDLNTFMFVLLRKSISGEVGRDTRDSILAAVGQILKNMEYTTVQQKLDAVHATMLGKKT